MSKLMKEMQHISDQLKTLDSQAGQIRESGKKIIGYLCSYVPEELILAAGFHPMRIFSSQPDILEADAHLQSYCCAPVRGILEDCLSGRLNFLDGMVFPQTCDTIQRLSDIWRMNREDAFFADLSWPVKMNTASSMTYAVTLLNTFKSQLEAYSGRPISDTALSAAIETTNRIRTLVSRIYQLHAEKPGVMQTRDLYTLIKGSMTLDKTQVIQALEDVNSRLESADPEPFSGKRVILSGATCEFPEITDLVEACGGHVAGDDFCTGLRWHDFQTRTDMEPVSALAHRYLNRMICPAKYQGLTARGDQLTEMARQHQAGGVIFLLAKFCDPHAFDYPYIRTALEKEKIKTLCIETDGPHQGGGQLSTRIETFIHTL